MKYSARYLSVAKLLVEIRSDVNVQNQCGNTPLHEAYFQGSLDIVNLLLANDADVNIENYKKQKPGQLLELSEVQNNKKQKVQFSFCINIKTTEEELELLSS